MIRYSASLKANKHFWMNDLDTYRIVNYIFCTRFTALNEIILARFTGVQLRIYDRFKNPKNFKGNINVPEPKRVELEEAIGDSAAALKECAKGKKVYLMWSGGIDSTLAFYAMLDAGMAFTVICDEHSEAENPKLAAEILGGQFEQVEHIKAENLKPLTADPNNYFVTGEIGDQIMGSMVTMRFSYQQRNMLLKDAIACDLFAETIIDVGRETERTRSVFQPGLLKRYNATKIITDMVSDTMKEMLGKTEENTTVAEFLWYLNFVHKYSSVIYRLFRIRMYGYGKLKNTYHFFDTVPFQQYALTHYEQNCAYIRDADYKMPFKGWIYQHDGNEDYLRNKLKEPSLKLTKYWYKK